MSVTNQQLKFGLFVLFSILGLGLLLWSAVDWFDLMSGARIQSSACSLNAYWNCDRAGLSPAGSLMGIPSGIFGALWFLTVGILGLSGSAFLAFRRVLMVTGLVVIGGMASYLFFVLKAGCIVCLASYVCLIGTVVTGWSLNREVIRPRTALFGAVIGALFLAAYASFRISRMDGKIPVEEIPAYWQSLPVKAVEAISPLSFGPADAKITVLEFSDFACPYCAIAADSMMTYLKSQSDIRVMFFPFPLDSQCNRAITRSMHPGVCDWSKVALCAQQQDRFWPVHDWIFAQMRSHQHLPKVEESWDSLGLDVEKAKSCMASAEIDNQLKEMVEAGLKLEIQSTPTFIFNGRTISGVLPVPVLRHLLTEARK